jgi:hypothetical protein
MPNQGAKMKRTDKIEALRCGRLVRRPGPGWKLLGCSVWEHSTGTRIHCLGRARWPNGETRHWTWEEEYAFNRRQGYNKKRALMVWALSLLSPNNPVRHEGAQPRSCL